MGGGGVATANGAEVTTVKGSSLVREGSGLGNDSNCEEELAERRNAADCDAPMSLLPL